MLGRRKIGGAVTIGEHGTVIGGVSWQATGGVRVGVGGVGVEEGRGGVGVADGIGVGVWLALGLPVGL